MAEAGRKTYPKRRGMPNRRQQQKASDNELKLCTAYLYRRDGCDKGETCAFLHVCRNYILKQCSAGGQCPFAHDLQSSQSRALFQRRFGIYRLEEETLQKFKELFAATLRNPAIDASLGEEESKKQGEEQKRQNQEKLRNFLQSFADTSKCPSFEQPPPAVTKPLFPQDPANTKPQFSTEKQPAICQFYLRGHCKFTGQMHMQRNYRHCSSPFQWQIQDSGTGIWLDFTPQHNNLVEENYCNVTCSGYTGMIIACCEKNSTVFEDLTIGFSADSFTSTDNAKGGKALGVRRLSTISHASAKLPFQKSESTHWIWYRMGDMKKWFEFPEEVSAGNDDSITSLTLERDYINFKNKRGPPLLELSPKQWRCTWQINFSRMEWFTSVYGHANPLPIARRPRWHGRRFQSEPTVRPKSAQVRHHINPAQPDAQVVRQDSSGPTHSTEVLPLLPASKASTNASPAPPSSDRRESLYICPYFLRGRCKYDDDKYSHKRHFLTTYQWQFMDTASSGTNWQNFTPDENDTVERSFCDVTQSLYNYRSEVQEFPVHTIRFDENPMARTINGSGIRRLSTSSSVLKINWETAFCSEWMWYWQDETGTWNLYSDQNATSGTQASIDSATIEQQFLDFERKRGESVIEFMAGSQLYKLDFTGMHQTNVRYSTCRKIRRRPKFVPMAKRMQLSRELSEAQRSAVVMPTTWDNRVSQRDMKLFTLTDNTSPEYTVIANLFRGTMDITGSIISIERVQNTELWEDFSKMSERMKKKNGGNPVPPKRLFHGTTTRTYANAICDQNFDWRLSGSNVGTAYGKGSYFARDAKFAHSYTKADDQNHRYLFVAQVLVGTCTTGDPTYTRPPPKNPLQPHGDLYNSCVNNIADPEIFVIFEKTQVYPEYLIRYKEKSNYQMTAAGRPGSILRQTVPASSSQTPQHAVPRAGAYNAARFGYPSTATASSVSGTQIPRPAPAARLAYQPGTASAQQPARPSPAAASRNTTYRRTVPSPPKEKSCTIQ